MDPLRALLLLAALLLGACVQLDTAPGVLIDSRPSGARVVVDGQDSGFVTPVHLGLSHEDHRIELVHEGYERAVIEVASDVRTGLIYYREAYLSPQTWHFWLWLNAQDGLMPVKIERGFWPQRIHVPLRLANEE